jgi:4-amino-4-deoxy-L-arabinose transferase-like glycosyltransferase
MTTHAPNVEASTPRSLWGRTLDIIRQYLPQLIILVSLLARIPLLTRPLTYREDIWREADTATIARNFLTDPNILLPRINWGGNGPGYVEAEFQLYPWTVSLLYRVFGEHAFIGRAVSLVLTGVALWLFWLLCQRLLTRRAALIALLFLAICPLYVRFSVAYMPEATTMAAYIGGLLLFDKWLEDHRWRTAIGCGVVTAIAGLVKPTALLIGLVFLLLLLARREARRLIQPQLLVLGALVVLPVGAWLVWGAHIHETYGNSFGVISGGDSKFGNVGYWISPDFYIGAEWLDMLWVFGIATLPLGIFGVITAIRRRAPLMLLCGFVAIMIYYFLVARPIYQTTGIQYHVFTMVFAGMAVGIGADRVLELEWPRSRRLSRSVVTLAMVGLAIGGGVVVADEFRDWGSNEITCGAQMRQYIPSTDLVAITSTQTSTTVAGKPANNQNPTLFYWGNVKGWSIAADHVDEPTLNSAQSAGARWLVVDYLDVIQTKAPLMAYLQGKQVVAAPTTDGHCGIYKLEK